MFASTQSAVSSIATGLKRLAKLYLDGFKLQAVEKLTLLLSALAFYAVAIALGLVCLVFISVGVGHLLATTIAPQLAYLIVALFYVVLLLVVCLMRRALFVDPIARFISKLLLDSPDNSHEEEKQ
jgi:CBS domain containing-hemolysin-like protein